MMTKKLLKLNSVSKSEFAFKYKTDLQQMVIYVTQNILICSQSMCS